MIDNIIVIILKNYLRNNIEEKKIYFSVSMLRDFVYKNFLTHTFMK